MRLGVGVRPLGMLLLASRCSDFLLLSPLHEHEALQNLRGCRAELEFWHDLGDFTGRCHSPPVFGEFFGEFVGVRKAVFGEHEFVLVVHGLVRRRHHVVARDLGIQGNGRNGFGGRRFGVAGEDVHGEDKAREEHCQEFDGLFHGI